MAIVVTLAASCGSEPDPITLAEARPQIERVCEELRSDISVPSLEFRLEEFSIELEIGGAIALGESVSYPAENLIAVLDVEALGRVESGLRSLAGDLSAIDTAEELEVTLGGPAFALAEAFETVSDGYETFDTDLDLDTFRAETAEIIVEVQSGAAAAGVPECLREGQLESLVDDAVVGYERFAELIAPTGDLTEDFAAACLRLDVNAADVALERAFSANPAPATIALGRAGAVRTLRLFLADIGRLPLDPAVLAEITERVDELEDAIDGFSSAALAEEAADSIPAAGDPDDAIVGSAAQAILDAESAFYATIGEIDPRCA